MALRQIAGPFPLVDENGNDVTASWVGIQYSYWIPGYGWVMPFAGWVCLVSLDGTVAKLNTQTPNSASGFDSRTGQIQLFISGKLYARERMVLLPFQINVPQPSPKGKFYELADRILATQGLGTVQSAPWGGVYADELVVPFPIQGSTAPFLAQGRLPSEVFIWNIVSSTFQGCFYDAVQRKITLNGLQTGIPTLAATYATDFGVIATIHANGSDYEVRIWSLDVDPSSVSNPTLIGGSTEPGQIATWQVTVLGANSDPVVGVQVTWSITGGGVLVETQSATDENGDAIVQVYYPSASASTSSTLEASVTY